MIRWREEIVQKLSLDYKKCWVPGPELSAPRYLLESVSCWLQSVGQLTRGQPGPGLGPVLGSQLSSQPRVRSPLHPSAHGWLSLTGMTISPPNHQQHPTLGSSNCLHGILSIMVSDWMKFEIPITDYWLKSFVLLFIFSIQLQKSHSRSPKISV